MNTWIVPHSSLVNAQGGWEYLRECECCSQVGDVNTWGDEREKQEVERKVLQEEKACKNCPSYHRAHDCSLHFVLEDLVFKSRVLLPSWHGVSGQILAGRAAPRITFHSSWIANLTKSLLDSIQSWQDTLNVDSMIYSHLHDKCCYFIFHCCDYTVKE